MRRALSMTLGTLALAACASGTESVGFGPAPTTYRFTEIEGTLVVTRVPNAFGYADGAEAKRAANDYCRGAGVASGPDDNFQGGAWVFLRGCA
ncbi:hypothetical protein OE699_07780 [Sedimentimonas flavescens]|uniref:YecR-like lipoprotein n=2 Tax=Rhodobacter group TaxID=3374108 RepID=A0ABT2ZYC0_9RHOB|nr:MULTISPECIES: hypothetical protein [Paracoccaceae]MBW0157741.1 hypothetical protein [Sedimentimonas flavescens]MCE5972980.1 hypothetical protein [Sinirhodobacter sp. WL0062]MCV2878750.1 hypothetical protein [Sedimentimonas flavescens]